MRLLFPFMFCTVCSLAQSGLDTTDFLTTATRTEEWLPFSQSWQAIDSTYTGYTLNNQRDTLERWRYDGENWLLQRRTLFDYLPNGLETQSNQQNYDPMGNLTRRQRTVFDYDEDGRLRLVMNQEDQNGEWQTVLRLTYLYREGQLIARNREGFSNGVTTSLERTEYQYDENGNTTQELFLELRGDSLFNDYRRVYTYNDQDQILALEEEEWSFTSWLPRARTEYQYMRTPTLAVDTAVTYQWLANDWRLFLRTIEERDLSEPRNQFEELQQWNGTNWIGFQRTQETYDPMARQQIRLFQQRLNEWQDVRRTLNDYDERGLKFLSTVQEAVNGSWVNELRTFYFYERAATPTQVSLPSLTGVHLYPNPATQCIQIELPADRTTNLQVGLYDTQGRIHLRQVLSPQGGRIDLPTSLPAGAYILRLRQGTAASSRLLQLVRN